MALPNCLLFKRIPLQILRLAFHICHSVAGITHCIYNLNGGAAVEDVKIKASINYEEYESQVLERLSKCVSGQSGCSSLRGFLVEMNGTKTLSIRFFLM